MSGPQAQGVLEAGCDFVVVGRGAILRHDFPDRVKADANYQSPQTPVTVQHLLEEGLSPAFVQYMRQWPNFVEAETTAA
jgi:2,4-dienoyl-CoA reductase-like NADH-dependent reductase (Old Yellow Enzyme family)